MKQTVSVETRRELCAAIAVRYRTADRQSKKLVLDEFVKITGYHRKHAIRLLRKGQAKMTVKSVSKQIYNVALEEALIVLWEAADRICGKRLKALLPTLIEAMERHGHLCLEANIRAQLLQISAATIDRRLQKVRAQAVGARRKKRSQNRIHKLVAIKTFTEWEQARPGLLEIDLVTHCGERAIGSFVHTLTLTDVTSGWTECVALPCVSNP